MGTTLASWEDSVINTLLKVIRLFEILPEENQASAGTTKGLVSDMMPLEYTGKFVK